MPMEIHHIIYFIETDIQIPLDLRNAGPTHIAICSPLHTSRSHALGACSQCSWRSLCMVILELWIIYLLISEKKKTWFAHWEPAFTAHMVPYVFQFWTNASGWFDLWKLLRNSLYPSLKPLSSTSVNQTNIPIFWCSNAIKLPFLLVKCHSIPTSCWAGSMPLRLHIFVEKKSQSITMFDHLSVSFFL